MKRSDVPLQLSTISSVFSSPAGIERSECQDDAKNYEIQFEYSSNTNPVGDVFQCRRRYSLFGIANDDTPRRSQGRRRLANGWRVSLDSSDSSLRHLSLLPQPAEAPGIFHGSNWSGIPCPNVSPFAMTLLRKFQCEALTVVSATLANCLQPQTEPSPGATV
jgi:hypothetical protein